MGSYKVPQNVEAEDKILGPLSLKQFIYALIGVGYGLLTFAILKPLSIVLWVILGLPPMLALLGLGLYQREDQPLETFVIAILQFFTRPKRRYWQKEPIAEVFRLEPPPPKPERAVRDARKVHSQLAQLANLVDTGGWSVKEPEIQEPDELPVVDLQGRIGTEALATPPAFATASEITQDDDMLNPQTAAARDLNTLIENSVKSLRQEAMDKMQPAGAPSVSGSTAAPSGAILKLATEGGGLTVAQIATQARRQSTNPGEGQSVDLSHVETTAT